nr:unnamed protein product [Callosobruchus chinensis]
MKIIDSNNCVGAEVECSNETISEVTSKTRDSDESENRINIKKASSDKLTETIPFTEDSNNSSIVIETKTSSRNLSSGNC